MVISTLRVHKRIENYVISVSIMLPLYDVIVYS